MTGPFVYIHAHGGNLPFRLASTEEVTQSGPKRLQTGKIIITVDLATDRREGKKK